MSLLAAIILISLILCAIAIPFFIRSFLWQSILKKIYAGQYDKAIQQMNAPLYTFLFSTYEKNYNIMSIQSYKICCFFTKYYYPFSDRYQRETSHLQTNRWPVQFELYNRKNRIECKQRIYL